MDHESKRRKAIKNNDFSLAYEPMGDNEEEIDAAMEEGKKFLLFMGCLTTLIFVSFLIAFFALVGDDFYGANQEVSPQLKGKYISSFVVLLFFRIFLY